MLQLDETVRFRRLWSQQLAAELARGAGQEFLEMVGLGDRKVQLAEAVRTMELGNGDGINEFVVSRARWEASLPSLVAAVPLGGTPRAQVARRGPCGAGVRVNAMAALENAVDRSGGVTKTYESGYCWL